MFLTVVPKKVPPPRILVRKSVPQILTQHHAFYYHIDETIRGTDSLPPQLLEKKNCPTKVSNLRNRSEYSKSEIQAQIWSRSFTKKKKKNKRKKKHQSFFFLKKFSPRMCLPPVPEGEIRPITFLFCLSVICLMKKTQQKSLKNKINFFVCGAPTSFFPRFLISGRENFF